MQLITRMFGTALHGNVLVPLMHFANHVSDLPCSCRTPHHPAMACLIACCSCLIAYYTELGPRV
jgi:hypothetical protein